MTEIPAGSSDTGELAESSSRPPAPLPSRKLTIPARRLAGSPACLNCGTPLVGPFCHYCGQPDKNLFRFFPVLVRELMADFLDFDSRFARTMRPLLFHPGKLTRDYLDGRRFRYTPPLRLYIFASMAFFLLAAALAGGVVSTNADGISFSLGTSGAGIQVDKGIEEAVKAGEMTEKEAEAVRQKLEEAGISRILDPGGNEPEGAAVGDEPSETGAASNALPNPSGTANDESPDSEAATTEDVININGKPWNRETNPFIVPGAPQFINDWINDEIEDSPRKGREIEENPDIIVDKIMDVLPVAVFIMLPLVALLLKFWYLFSGHYYVEHLIHALHNHAFLFVVFILMLVTDTVASIAEPTGQGTWTEISLWIDIVLGCWIPLYLLISLKTVYRQGWIFTLLKFGLVGISYMVLLALVTSATAVASFVLL